MVIVVIAAIALFLDDASHESSIKRKATNPHPDGAAGSGRHLYRGSADQ